MPVYHKLVRDLIPQMIEATGKTCVTSILEPNAHLREIKTKMQEEALELQEATSKIEAVEELADILELVHTALAIYGVTYEQLEQVRVLKREQRGGFLQGIYLIEVEE
ncbi:putative house-cleaning noncanonical NTP pyrophosphatase (MazG superfamily) [Lysinibacillus parviboronicapiens]|uniref:House-cleaning noncanonical NTP pyrophosphatase (MazG superfamily) n=1 Tax=Lysinibacillus parviboronicapiens TaxID=436516 RepID=A0ABV2PGW9_9BACI|nr:nucleoside triphosphate pyrophosphohydrolase [Lysinibacillus parviboronicapiens]